MTAFQSHTTFNAASVSQSAAQAALTLGAPIDDSVRVMVEQFRRRRDAAMAILSRAPGIRVVPPEGAFYLFIEAPGAGRVRDAGNAFASRLLEEHDLAVVPGSAFLAPDWIRVSYAAKLDQVEEGMRRIVAAHGAT
jgi:aspartate aminotransferase